MASYGPSCLEDGARSPQPVDIYKYLTSRTGAEIVQLTQGMQDTGAQAALTTALLFMPSEVPSRATPPVKTKKALNSFVGFRSYYRNIPLFKEHQMKVCSPSLGLLWEADENKSKWSLITKAWSIIRDQVGKEYAPLDEFFSYACPYLNIPSPEQYLGIYGWVPVVNQEDELTIARGPGYATGYVEAVTMDEAPSVEDIIRHCQSQGYAQTFILTPNLTTTTFLGHSNAANSRTVAMKQTATSAPAAAKRAIARKKRQARRELAQQKGISQFFNSPSGLSEALSQVEVMANNNASSGFTLPAEEQSFGMEGSCQNTYTAPAPQDHADESLYNSLREYVADPSIECIGSGQEGVDMGLDNTCSNFDWNDLNNQSIDVQLGLSPQGEFYPSLHESAENTAAFRMGADTDTTLPLYMDFSLESSMCLIPRFNADIEDQSSVTLNPGTFLTSTHSLG